MEKFLGAFLVKTTTGQKSPAKEKGKAANGLH